MTSAQGCEERPPRGRRLPWDRSRPVDLRLLAAEFLFCITSWVVVVELLTRDISGPDLLASVATGFVLVGVSWALANCALPPAAHHAARKGPGPGDDGGPAPSGAAMLA
jgi:hypothetical protein